MVAKQIGIAVNRRQCAYVTVLGGLQLGDTAFAQLADLIVGQRGSAQHVAQQLDHQVRIAREKLTRDGDEFGFGRGAEFAANRVDGFSKLGRTALTRALLQQPCQQVRGAA